MYEDGKYLLGATDVTPTIYRSSRADQPRSHGKAIPSCATKRDSRSRVLHPNIKS